MAKVVINNCYGGFGVSIDGIIEILKRRGISETYVYTSAPHEMREKGIKYIKGRKRYGVHYVTTKDYGENTWELTGDKYSKYSFSRTDPDLIALIEEKGSEFMSAPSAHLEVAEYDEENFECTISDYDGSEFLELIPIVTEKRLEECTSVEETISYLESLDINVRRRTDRG